MMAGERLRPGLLARRRRLVSEARETDTAMTIPAGARYGALSMLIYLLRHGRAEDGFGMRDEERALTSDGWERLRAAAPAWTRLVKAPQIVFQSPLRRAQESASVLIEAVSGQPDVRTDPALTPGSHIPNAMRLIEAELLGGTESIAFVGHEPHLGYLLGMLLTGDERHSIPFKKGMLAAVEFASTSLIGELRFSLTQKAAANLE